MTAVARGTTAEILAGALRAAGIDAIYGDPVDGLAATPVRDPDLAELLASTHRRVVGRPALVARGSQLRLPGSDPVRSVVGSPADAAALPAALAAADASGLVIDLDVDLQAPADGAAIAFPPPVDRRQDAPEPVAQAIAAADAPMVLAGPGVVSAGAVPGLHALAAAGRLGVLNTWGAKGVFDWRSRHHLATVGLQSWDFDLGGLPESDLVIATGVDLDESPAARWEGRRAVIVDPHALASLAELVDRSGPWLPVPELRHRLAAITQEGWAATGAPCAPSAVTRNYGAVLGAGGLIAADAGTAGFWVARTFSTTEVGSAQVPATVIDGFAAAAALVSRLVSPRRKVLAVIDGAPSDVTRRLADLADTLGLGFAIEAWSDDGERLEAGDHLDRLSRLAVVPRSEVVMLAPAPWQLPAIVDAAGPVVAWDGPMHMC